VVGLSIDEHGRVQHTTVRHTRTGIEDAVAGWSPAHVVAFVARHAGLAAGGPGDVAGARAATGGGAPPPAGAPVPVDLDAGHLVGGRRRSAHLTVTAPALGRDVAEYDYDLAVTARALGRRDWRPLGRVRGRARPGDDLAVDIAADLAPGVHRITLGGHATPAPPVGATAAAVGEPGAGTATG
jgi:hypothetical protein